MSLPNCGPDALRIEVASVEVVPLLAVETIDGVAITFAAGRNGPGTGYIRCSASSEISWKEPGSTTWGDYVNVSAGGAFVLHGGDDRDAFVRVAVDTTYLPTDVAEHRVLMADVFNNDVGSDDVTAAEAAAGDAETWTLTVANDSTYWVQKVTFWLDAAVADLEISHDGAAWVSPVTEATGLVLADIGPATSITLHLKRTIGAGAPLDTDVLNHLHSSWTGGPG